MMNQGELSHLALLFIFVVESRAHFSSALLLFRHVWSRRSARGEDTPGGCCDITGEANLLRKQRKRNENMKSRERRKISGASRVINYALVRLAAARCGCTCWVPRYGNHLRVWNWWNFWCGKCAFLVHLRSAHFSQISSQPKQSRRPSINHLNAAHVVSFMLGRAGDESRVDTFITQTVDVRLFTHIKRRSTFMSTPKLLTTAMKMRSRKVSS
jgi:hypothetical protein